MSRPTTILLAFFSFPLATFAATFTQSARTVDCFDFVEVTVSVASPPEGNPFAGAEVTGEFALVVPADRTPSPQAVKVDGFCDHEDGSVFRIRFMPTQPGRHDYSVTYRRGGAMETHAGSFTARAGQRKGIVRVDREYPNHFVREGSGEHFFWNSTTTYALIGWRDDAVIRESIDRLARLKINRIRAAIVPPRVNSGMQWREPVVTNDAHFSFCVNAWPAARPESVDDPGFGVSRFNVPHWQKFERLLRHARERDVMVSVIFYVDGRLKGVDPFRKEGMGGADEQRFYRYAAARFAAFANVMWDVTNEYRLFRTNAWAEQMGAFLRACDPYDHLTSIHGHPDFTFRKSAWVDYAMYQEWDEAGGYDFMLRNRREQAATGRPMPQINEEYGYEDHYPYPWGQARKWPARTADTRRRLAWEMAMAGTYQTTGERADIEGMGGWITGRGNDRMTMLESYAHLRGFFEAFDWWKLEPRPDLLTILPDPPLPARARPRDSAPPTPALHGKPVLLAQPGTCYVAYLPRGGAVTARLDAGSYRTRWFNPRTGQFTGKVGTAAAGEWISPPAADAEDWVLLIESM